jgi:hypothetical protein
MEQNTALQRQVQEGPGNLLKKVEQNLKSPSSVTAANGGGTAARGLPVDESQLDSLSDEELEALLNG